VSKIPVLKIGSILSMGLTGNKPTEARAGLFPQNNQPGEHGYQRLEQFQSAIAKPEKEEGPEGSSLRALFLSGGSSGFTASPVRGAG